MSTNKLMSAARAYAHAHDAFKAFSACLDNEIGGPARVESPLENDVRSPRELEPARAGVTSESCEEKIMTKDEAISDLALIILELIECKARPNEFARPRMVLRLAEIAEFFKKEPTHEKG